MRFPMKHCIQSGADGGAFKIPFKGKYLHVIASNGLGWEHVSVSLDNRCPNWNEMCHVKSLFWEDNEVVMQLHVEKENHINLHPYCLHLWKPIDLKIPLPPNFMV